MGSSLVLTGGAATAKTLKESISLSNHGFSAGDVLRWSGSSGGYVLAKADSAVNAEVLGIVNSKVDNNTFELTYGGYIDLPQFSGISYPVLFLDSIIAGGLTHNPPSALGTVVKPVVTRHPTLNGFVLNNYLGTQIGGSSTIGIDEIQPVGTIMPFAGTSIPDTWLECNGATYSMSSYPELYSKLCYTTGDRAPIYGHVFTVTTSTVNYASGKSATDIANNISAGVYLRYGAGGAGVVPYLIAKVLSITGSGNAITLTAQVVPIYDTTSKTFVVPNLILPTGNTINGIGNLNAGWGEDYVIEAVASTVSVTSFCVPNLRGRTIIGTNSSVYSLDEADDPEFIRSSIGLYPQGAHGGEEKHTLTTSEMPAHDHGLFGTLTSVVARTAGAGELQVNVGTAASEYPVFISDTGSNAAHNNMPPYLAVRYIIKAKPYTRAAIIDGVDLPYSNLLIRSTDSNSLRSELLSGASGGDLVFYTNSGEASKTGTERMRLTAGGKNLSLNTADSYFSAAYSSANSQYSSKQGWNWLNLGNNGANWIVAGSESAIPQSGSLYIVTGNTNVGGITYSVSSSIPHNGVTAMYIDRFGNVGINMSTAPGASLDVNGTLKVGNFGGATNVMVKPTNAAGGVGQVIPLFTWGAGIGSASIQRNHAAPIPSGTWFVFLKGHGDNSSQSENATMAMAQTWVVPSGKYLVFAHSDGFSAIASETTSGLAWKLINSTDVGLYRTASNDFPYTSITSANGWNNICKTNGTAQLINEQNADTATGGDKSASGCVYQGGGGWNVTGQITGYAIRIA